jgi:hypothetical protein
MALPIFDLDERETYDMNLGIIANFTLDGQPYDMPLNAVQLAIQQGSRSYDQSRGNALYWRTPDITVLPYMQRVTIPITLTGTDRVLMNETEWRGGFQEGVGTWGKLPAVDTVVPFYLYLQLGTYHPIQKIYKANIIQVAQFNITTHAYIPPEFGGEIIVDIV